MDIRLKVPEKNIEKFIQWFKSGKDRELTYDREFEEELILNLPEDKRELFNNLQTRKLISGSFDVFFDEEKKMLSIKPMDIISVDLTETQKQTLIEFVLNNETCFVLATEKNILEGSMEKRDGNVAKIGSHTKKTLVQASNLFNL